MLAGSVWLGDRIEASTSTRVQRSSIFGLSRKPPSSTGPSSSAHAPKAVADARRAWGARALDAAPMAWLEAEIMVVSAPCALLNEHEPLRELVLARIEPEEVDARGHARAAVAGAIPNDLIAAGRERLDEAAHDAPGGVVESQADARGAAARKRKRDPRPGGGGVGRAAEQHRLRGRRRDTAAHAEARARDRRGAVRVARDGADTQHEIPRAGRGGEILGRQCDGVSPGRQRADPASRERATG